MSALKHFRTAALSLALIAFALVIISYGLRSGIYLKVRMTPKLQTLGEMLGGTFDFKDIYAIGLTGIALENVVFRPHIAGAHPISFDSVIIYPDLPGMFVGDLNASKIQLQRAQLTLSLNPDNADKRWLDALKLKRFDQSTLSPKLAASEKTMPLIQCEDCLVRATYRNYFLEVKVPNEQIEFSKIQAKTLDFAQNPVHICVESPSRNLCFDAAASGITCDQDCLIPSLNLSNLVSGFLHIHHLQLKNVTLSHNAQRTACAIESGALNAEIPLSSPFNALAGQYRFRFSTLELLFDRPNHRLGAGILLRTQKDAAARFYGAFDFAHNQLALTCDAAKFDFARYLKNSALSKYIAFRALPVSGKIAVRADLENNRVALDLKTAVLNAELSAPALASSPLSDIRLSLKTSGWFDFSDFSFQFDKIDGALGSIPFRLSAARLPTSTHTHLHTLNFLTHANSANLIPALPKGFAPLLDGYTLSGPFKFGVSLRFLSNQIDDLELDTTIDLSKVQTLSLSPNTPLQKLATDDFQIPVAAAKIPLILDPNSPEWLPFRDLPKHTAYTFIASEDSKFFSHNGFDLRALRASIIANLKAKKIVRGGSTISQQVVKNLFLSHEKTASRKFQEAFLTWQLENHVSKIRIFELYLNLAHFAKNVYGLRAAALFYFNKTVPQLTLRESLFLAAILPNPIIFGNQYFRNALSPSRIEKMINVGTALKHANRISQDDWNHARPLLQQGIISDKPPIY